MSTTLVSELNELGLTAAADHLVKDKALAVKLRIAFEHFRVVSLENITRFNTELKQRTVKGDKYYRTYDQLAFTPLGSYRHVPPKEVLQKLKEAKALNCFDSYEVATIKSVEVRPDPVLFGRIEGSNNRYFVAQWDNDVKLEDILREDEG